MSDLIDDILAGVRPGDVRYRDDISDVRSAGVIAGAHDGVTDDYDPFTYSRPRSGGSGGSGSGGSGSPGSNYFPSTNPYGGSSTYNKYDEDGNRLDPDYYFNPNEVPGNRVVTDKDVRPDPNDLDTEGFLDVIFPDRVVDRYTQANKGGMSKEERDKWFTGYAGSSEGKAIGFDPAEAERLGIAYWNEGFLGDNLADKQGTGEQLLRGVGRIIPSIALQIGGDFSSLLSPSDFTGSIFEGEDNVTGNYFSRWFKKKQEDLNENMKIHMKEDAGVGSSAWWISNGSDLISSVLSDVVTSMGVGALGKVGASAAKSVAMAAVKGFMKSSKIKKAAELFKAVRTGEKHAKNLKPDEKGLYRIAEYMNKVSNGSFLKNADKIKQFGAAALNATITNHMESLTMGIGIYDETYRKALEMGYGDEYAKNVAAQAAQSGMNINKATTALNLTSAHLANTLGKGVKIVNKGAQREKSYMRRKIRQALSEAGQEATEEMINAIAEEQGKMVGERILTNALQLNIGDVKIEDPRQGQFAYDYKGGLTGLYQAFTSPTLGVDYSNITGDLTGKELFESALLGAIGGIGGTAGTMAIGHQLGSSNSMLNRMFKGALARKFGNQDVKRHTENQYDQYGRIIARAGDPVIEMEAAKYDKDVKYKAGDILTDDIKDANGNVVVAVQRGENNAPIVRQLNKDDIAKLAKTSAVKYKAGETIMDIVKPATATEREVTAPRMVPKLDKEGKVSYVYEDGADRYFSAYELEKKQFEKERQAFDLVKSHAEKYAKIKNISNFKASAAILQDNINMFFTEDFSQEPDKREALIESIAQELAATEAMMAGKDPSDVELKDAVDKIKTEISSGQLYGRELSMRADAISASSLDQSILLAIENGSEESIINVFEDMMKLKPEQAAEMGYGDDYKEKAKNMIDKVKRMSDDYYEYKFKHGEVKARKLLANRLMKEGYEKRIDSYDEAIFRPNAESVFEQYAREAGLQKNTPEYREAHRIFMELAVDKKTSAHSKVIGKAVEDLKKNREKAEKELEENYNDMLALQKQRETEVGTTVSVLEGKNGNTIALIRDSDGKVIETITDDKMTMDEVKALAEKRRKEIDQKKAAADYAKLKEELDQDTDEDTDSEDQQVETTETEETEDPKSLLPYDQYKRKLNALLRARRELKNKLANADKDLKETLINRIDKEFKDKVRELAGEQYGMISKYLAKLNPVINNRAKYMEYWYNLDNEFDKLASMEGDMLLSEQEKKRYFNTQTQMMFNEQLNAMMNMQRAGGSTLMTMRRLVRVRVATGKTNKDGTPETRMENRYEEHHTLGKIRMNSKGVPEFYPDDENVKIVDKEEAQMYMNIIRPGMEQEHERLLKQLEHEEKREETVLSKEEKEKYAKEGKALPLTKKQRIAKVKAKMAELEFYRIEKDTSSTELDGDYIVVPFYKTTFTRSINDIYVKIKTGEKTKSKYGKGKYQKKGKLSEAADKKAVEEQKAKEKEEEEKAKEKESEDAPKSIDVDKKDTEVKEDAETKEGPKVVEVEKKEAKTEAKDEDTDDDVDTEGGENLELVDEALKDGEVVDSEEDDDKKVVEEVGETDEVEMEDDDLSLTDEEKKANAGKGYKMVKLSSLKKKGLRAGTKVYALRSGADMDVNPTTGELRAAATVQEFTLRRGFTPGQTTATLNAKAEIASVPLNLNTIHMFDPLDRDISFAFQMQERLRNEERHYILKYKREFRNIDKRFDELKNNEEILKTSNEELQQHMESIMKLYGRAKKILFADDADVSAEDREYLSGLMKELEPQLAAVLNSIRSTFSDNISEVIAVEFKQRFDELAGFYKKMTEHEAHKAETQALISAATADARALKEESDQIDALIADARAGKQSSMTIKQAKERIAQLSDEERELHAIDVKNHEADVAVATELQSRIELAVEEYKATYENEDRKLSDEEVEARNEELAELESMLNEYFDIVGKHVSNFDRTSAMNNIAGLRKSIAMSANQARRTSHMLSPTSTFVENLSEITNSPHKLLVNAVPILDKLTDTPMKARELKVEVMAKLVHMFKIRRKRINHAISNIDATRNKLNNDFLEIVGIIEKMKTFKARNEDVFTTIESVAGARNLKDLYKIFDSLDYNEQDYQQALAEYTDLDGRLRDLALLFTHMGLTDDFKQIIIQTEGMQGGDKPAKRIELLKKYIEAKINEAKSNRNKKFSNVLSKVHDGHRHNLEALSAIFDTVLGDSDPDEKLKKVNVFGEERKYNSQYLVDTLNMMFNSTDDSLMFRDPIVDKIAPDVRESLIELVSKINGGQITPKDFNNFKGEIAILSTAIQGILDSSNVVNSIEIELASIPIENMNLSEKLFKNAKAKFPGLTTDTAPTNMYEYLEFWYELRAFALNEMSKDNGAESLDVEKYLMSQGVLDSETQQLVDNANALFKENEGDDPTLAAIYKEYQMSLEAISGYEYIKKRFNYLSNTMGANDFMGLLKYDKDSDDVLMPNIDAYLAEIEQQMLQKARTIDFEKGDDVESETYGFNTYPGLNLKTSIALTLGKIIHMSKAKLRSDEATDTDAELSMETIVGSINEREWDILNKNIDAAQMRLEAQRAELQEKYNQIEAARAELRNRQLFIQSGFEIVRERIFRAYEASKQTIEGTYEERKAMRKEIEEKVKATSKQSLFNELVDNRQLFVDLEEMEEELEKNKELQKMYTMRGKDYLRQIAQLSSMIMVYTKSKSFAEGMQKIEDAKAAGEIDAMVAYDQMVKIYDEYSKVSEDYQKYIYVLADNMPSEGMIGYEVEERRNKYISSLRSLIAVTDTEMKLMALFPEFSEGLQNSIVDYNESVVVMEKLTPLYEERNRLYSVLKAIRTQKYKGGVTAEQSVKDAIEKLSTTIESLRDKVNSSGLTINERKAIEEEIVKTDAELKKLKDKYGEPEPDIDGKIKDATEVLTKIDAAIVEAKEIFDDKMKDIDAGAENKTKDNKGEVTSSPTETEIKTYEIYEFESLTTEETGVTTVSVPVKNQVEITVTTNNDDDVDTKTEVNESLDKQRNDAVSEYNKTVEAILEQKNKAEEEVARLNKLKETQSDPEYIEKAKELGELKTRLVKSLTDKTIGMEAAIQEINDSKQALQKLLSIQMTNHASALINRKELELRYKELLREYKLTGNEALKAKVDKLEKQYNQDEAHVEVYKEFIDQLNFNLRLDNFSQYNYENMLAFFMDQKKTLENVEKDITERIEALDDAISALTKEKGITGELVETKEFVRLHAALHGATKKKKEAFLKMMEAEEAYDKVANKIAELRDKQTNEHANDFEDEDTPESELRRQERTKKLKEIEKEIKAEEKLLTDLKSKRTSARGANTRAIKAYTTAIAKVNKIKYPRQFEEHEIAAQIFYTIDTSRTFDSMFADALNYSERFSGAREITPESEAINALLSPPWFNSGKDTPYATVNRFLGFDGFSATYNRDGTPVVTKDVHDLRWLNTLNSLDAIDANDLRLEIVSVSNSSHPDVENRVSAMATLPFYTEEGRDGEHTLITKDRDTGASGIYVVMTNSKGEWLYARDKMENGEMMTMWSSTPPDQTNPNEAGYRPVFAKIPTNNIGSRLKTNALLKILKKHGKGTGVNKVESRKDFMALKKITFDNVVYNVDRTTVDGKANSDAVMMAMEDPKARVSPLVHALRQHASWEMDIFRTNAITTINSNKRVFAKLAKDGIRSNPYGVLRRKKRDVIRQTKDGEVVKKERDLSDLSAFKEEGIIEGVYIRNNKKSSMRGLPYMKLTNGQVVDLYNAKQSPEDVLTGLLLLSQAIKQNTDKKGFNNDIKLFNEEDNTEHSFGIMNNKDVKDGLLSRLFRWTGKPKPDQSIPNMSIWIEGHHIHFNWGGTLYNVNTSVLVQFEKYMKSLEATSAEEVLKHLDEASGKFSGIRFLAGFLKEKRANVSHSLLTRGSDIYYHPRYDVAAGRMIVDKYTDANGKAYQEFLINQAKVLTDAYSPGEVNRMGLYSPNASTYVAFEDELYTEASAAKATQVKKTSKVEVDFILTNGDDFQMTTKSLNVRPGDGVKFTFTKFEMKEDGTKVQTTKVVTGTVQSGKTASDLVLKHRITNESTKQTIDTQTPLDQIGDLYASEEYVLTGADMLSSFETAKIVNNAGFSDTDTFMRFDNLSELSLAQATLINDRIGLLPGFAYSKAANVSSTQKIETVQLTAEDKERIVENAKTLYQNSIYKNAIKFNADGEISLESLGINNRLLKNVRVKTKASDSGILEEYTISGSGLDLNFSSQSAFLDTPFAPKDPNLKENTEAFQIANSPLNFTFKVKRRAGEDVYDVDEIRIEDSQGNNVIPQLVHRQKSILAGIHPITKEPLSDALKAHMHKKLGNHAGLMFINQMQSAAVRSTAVAALSNPNRVMGIDKGSLDASGFDATELEKRKISSNPADSYDKAAVVGDPDSFWINMFGLSHIDTNDHKEGAFVATGAYNNVNPDLIDKAYNTILSGSFQDSTFSSAGSLLIALLSPFDASSNEGLQSSSGIAALANLETRLLEMANPIVTNPATLSTVEASTDSIDIAIRELVNIDRDAIEKAIAENTKDLSDDENTTDTTTITPEDNIAAVIKRSNDKIIRLTYDILNWKSKPHDSYPREAWTAIEKVFMDRFANDKEGVLLSDYQALDSVKKHMPNPNESWDDFNNQRYLIARILTDNLTESDPTIKFPELVETAMLGSILKAIKSDEVKTAIEDAGAVGGVEAVDIEDTNDGKHLMSVLNFLGKLKDVNPDLYNSLVSKLEGIINGNLTDNDAKIDGVTVDRDTAYLIKDVLEMDIDFDNVTDLDSTEETTEQEPEADPTNARSFIDELLGTVKITHTLSNDATQFVRYLANLQQVNKVIEQKMDNVGIKGYIKDGKIYINEELEPLHKLGTIVHETAHAMTLDETSDLKEQFNDVKLVGANLILKLINGDNDVLTAFNEAIENGQKKYLNASREDVESMIIYALVGNQNIKTLTKLMEIFKDDKTPEAIIKKILDSQKLKDGKAKMWFRELVAMPPDNVIVADFFNKLQIENLMADGQASYTIDGKSYGFDMQRKGTFLSMIVNGIKSLIKTILGIDVAEGSILEYMSARVFSNPEKVDIVHAKKQGDSDLQDYIDRLESEMNNQVPIENDINDLFKDEDSIKSIAMQFNGDIESADNHAIAKHILFLWNNGNKDINIKC